MLKITDKVLAIANEVSEFTIAVSNLNGSPILLISHKALGDMKGVLPLDALHPAHIGRDSLFVNDEGRLIADVVWNVYYSDDVEREEIEEHECVDITETVKKICSLESGCFKRFKEALAHPEWHERFMARKAFKFLSALYADEIANRTFEDDEEE